MRLMIMMKTLCIVSSGYGGKDESTTGFIDVYEHGNDCSADTTDFEDNDENTLDIRISE